MALRKRPPSFDRRPGAGPKTRFGGLATRFEGSPVPEKARIMTADKASCALGFEGPLAECAVLLNPESEADHDASG